MSDVCTCDQGPSLHSAGHRLRLQSPAGLWALVTAVTAADGFETCRRPELDAAYGACLSSRLPTRLTAFTPLSSHPAKHIETNITVKFIQKNRCQSVKCDAKVQQCHTDIYWRQTIVAETRPHNVVLVNFLCHKFLCITVY